MYHRQCRYRTQFWLIMWTFTCTKSKLAQAWEKKNAVQFVKHCDLFHSWTVTRLGQILTDLCLRCLLPLLVLKFLRWCYLKQLILLGKERGSLPSALPWAVPLCPAPPPSDPAVLFIEEIWHTNPAENLPWCGGIQLLWLVCEGKENQGALAGRKILKNKNQRGWLGGTQLQGRDGAQQNWLKSQAQSQDLWQLCDVYCSRVVSLWAFGGDVQGVCCGQTLP